MPKGRTSLYSNSWVSNCFAFHSLVYPSTCVLISQRLWGNPSHLSYLESSLRDKHSEEKLHILVSKTNSDTFTYDGIDLGAERVTQEIETHIRSLEKNGCKIKKLSIVGYSLGGLVARYTIGLLCTYFWSSYFLLLDLRMSPGTYLLASSPQTPSGARCTSSKKRD